VKRSRARRSFYAADQLTLWSDETPGAAVGPLSAGRCEAFKASNLGSCVACNESETQRAGSGQLGQQSSPSMPLPPVPAGSEVNRPLTAGPATPRVERSPVKINRALTAGPATLRSKAMHVRRPRWLREVIRREKLSGVPYGPRVGVSVPPASTKFTLPGGVIR
jgi:hypothetical protein